MFFVERLKSLIFKEKEMSYLIYLEDQGFSYKPKKGRLGWKSESIRDSIIMGTFQVPRGPLRDKINHDLIFTTQAIKEEDIPE